MPDLRRVTVFSDCQAVMNALAAGEGDHFTTLDPLVKRAFEACDSLWDDRNARVAVCWCPGHIGFGGNEKADALSREIRRYNLRHLVPEEQPACVSGYEIPFKYLERARRRHWWRDGADFEWTANMPRKHLYPVAVGVVCDEEACDEAYEDGAYDEAYDDEEYGYEADDEASADELSSHCSSATVQIETRKRKRSASDLPDYPSKRQRTGRPEHGIKP
ncbi:hypothetical protein BDP55DRAFT_647390 [Colletotrichum godetiae]|uniref:RNase H type-1 domain-containing protein n=1 Tax=Colletotrichum godetiae TaxID=1209918 RepID=A0AAJ0B0L1_9PEZI|nr:uncharacterized protein BDP55DRAFT_647390 [Colletotrichum godetiae]KAK1691549.1 hypothetical protein BDP55DRAFT_647390 [Colletotrichum godetiae]